MARKTKLDFITGVRVFPNKIEIKYKTLAGIKLLNITKLTSISELSKATIKDIKDIFKPVKYTDGREYWDIDSTKAIVDKADEFKNAKLPVVVEGTEPTADQDKEEDNSVPNDSIDNIKVTKTKPESGYTHQMAVEAAQALNQIFSTKISYDIINGAKGKRKVMSKPSKKELILALKNKESEISKLIVYINWLLGLKSLNSSLESENKGDLITESDTNRNNK